MPDLLTHALIGYTLGTALSVRYEWLTSHWVTVIMAGAMVPDIDKISLFLSDPLMEQLLGFPFSWEILHLPIGSALLCAVGALLVDTPHRRRTLVLLLFGASSHILLDQLSIFTTGYSYPQLWPLTEYHFPAGGLNKSSDRWPALFSAGLATTVYLAKTRFETTNRSIHGGK